MSNTKSAFVTIPIVSSFLIVGIVVCLQWAPFHKRTLKKPGTNKHLFILKLIITLMMKVSSWNYVGIIFWQRMLVTSCRCHHSEDVLKSDTLSPTSAMLHRGTLIGVQHLKK